MHAGMLHVLGTLIIKTHSSMYHCMSLHQPLPINASSSALLVVTVRCTSKKWSVHAQRSLLRTECLPLQSKVHRAQRYKPSRSFSILRGTIGSWRVWCECVSVTAWRAREVSTVVLGIVRLVVACTMTTDSGAALFLIWNIYLAVHLTRTGLHICYVVLYMLFLKRPSETMCVFLSSHLDVFA